MKFSSFAKRSKEYIKSAAIDRMGNRATWSNLYFNGEYSETYIPAGILYFSQIDGSVLFFSPHRLDVERRRPVFPSGFFLTKRTVERIYVTRPVLLSSIKSAGELSPASFSDGVHKTRS